jgi:hypothetical protein
MTGPAAPRLAPEPPATLAPPGGAAELAALVREASAAGARRELLCLRLSALPARLRRPHHRRLLEQALAPLRGSGRLRRFDLPNGDMVAAALPPALLLDRLRLELAGLLEEDDFGAVLLRHALPEDAPAVLALIEESLGLGGGAAEAAPAGRPLDVPALARLERDLAMADVTPFHRCQMVCRLTPGGEAEPVWEDDRLMPDRLLAALAPGLQPAGAPGLRARLRRLLDARQMAELTRPAEAARIRPRAIAPALASLASPAFERLDAALPMAARQALLLLLDPRDILDDPPAFARASDFALRRGYRLGLDAAAPAQLALLPPERLGIGTIRLVWSRALMADPAVEALAARHRLVLAGADRPAAVAWGWERGISLFQGKVIERRGLH